METQILEELQSQTSTLESTLSKIDQLYNLSALALCICFAFFIVYLLIKWSNK